MQPTQKLWTLLKQSCVAVTLVMTTVSAQASEDAVSNDGPYHAGAERIEISDRIRMYSQQISALACLVDAGIDVGAHRAEMQNAITEVDALLIAIRDGDADRGVALAEDDRKMLMAIRGVQLQWDTYRDAARLRLDDGAQALGPDYVSRQNLNLMHASKYLVSETMNHYAIPPVLLQADAFTLQIAARQRTLAQQIAKEACGVVTGNAVMGSEVRLSKSTRRFNASLNALVNGLAAAGVSAPATPEIKDALTTLASDWTALYVQLDGVNADNDAALAADIYGQLNALMIRFDALVPLYVAQSKSDI